jgi:hypothetical protein
MLEFFIILSVLPWFSFPIALIVVIAFACSGTSSNLTAKEQEDLNQRELSPMEKEIQERRKELGMD